MSHCGLHFAVLPAQCISHSLPRLCRMIMEQAVPSAAPGRKPCMLAAVCYRSPCIGTELPSKTILLMWRRIFLPPLIISHAIPGSDLLWEGKKSPVSFISFIQLPILKPLARMSHIYICYHIILCSISVATCPLFLTTKVCCRKNKQLAATLKDCLPRWQCP